MLFYAQADESDLDWGALIGAGITAAGAITTSLIKANAAKPTATPIVAGSMYATPATVNQAQQAGAIQVIQAPASSTGMDQKTMMLVMGGGAFLLLMMVMMNK